LRAFRRPVFEEIRALAFFKIDIKKYGSKTAQAENKEGGRKVEEIRCKKCRRLLMKVVNNFSSCGVYIKCPKCHYYQRFGSALETEEEKNLGKENPRRI